MYFISRPIRRARHPPDGSSRVPLGHEPLHGLLQRQDLVGALRHQRGEHVDAVFLNDSRMKSVGTQQTMHFLLSVFILFSNSYTISSTFYLLWNTSSHLEDELRFDCVELPGELLERLLQLQLGQLPLRVGLQLVLLHQLLAWRGEAKKRKNRMNNLFKGYANYFKLNRSIQNKDKISPMLSRSCCASTTNAAFLSPSSWSRREHLVLQLLIPGLQGGHTLLKGGPLALQRGLQRRVTQSAYSGGGVGEGGINQIKKKVNSPLRPIPQRCLALPSDPSPSAARHVCLQRQHLLLEQGLKEERWAFGGAGSQRQNSINDKSIKPVPGPGRVSPYICISLYSILYEHNSYQISTFYFNK